MAAALVGARETSGVMCSALADVLATQLIASRWLSADKYISPAGSLTQDLVLTSHLGDSPNSQV